jgi:hypothetical protein
MIRAGAIGGLLAVLAAGPAAALSCMVPSPQATYWRHQDAAETYVAAYGSFGGLFGFRHDRAADRVTFVATFIGHTAAGDGFTRPFEARVEIVQPLWTGIAGGGGDPKALANWLPGQTGIVYLEKTGSGYRLTADICNGLIDTDADSVKPTLRCLRGGRCPRP